MDYSEQDLLNYGGTKKPANKTTILLVAVIFLLAFIILSKSGDVETKTLPQPGLAATTTTLRANPQPAPFYSKKTNTNSEIVVGKRKDVIVHSDIPSETHHSDKPISPPTTISHPKPKLNTVSGTVSKVIR